MLDEAEGADMLMVKPALAYLDVIRRVRESIDASARGVQRVGRVLGGEGRGRARLARRSRRSCARTCRPWFARARTSSSRITPARRWPGGGSERRAEVHGADGARRARDARRRQFAGAGVPRRRRHAALPAVRLGRRVRGRRRPALHRLRLLVGSADPRARTSRGAARDHRDGRARHELRRAVRAARSSSPSTSRPAIPVSSRCASSRPAPRRR